MNRIKSALLGIAVAIALLGGVVACGTSNNQAPPMPASFVVNYAGTCYVGYEYTPDELLYTGAFIPPNCIRMAYPAYPPTTGLVSFGYMILLWNHYLSYDTYYHSSYYYDHVIIRTHYSISRASFVSYSHDFDSRNASSIKTYSAKAKWSNGKTGAYKFPTSNSKVNSGPITNKSGNTGFSNSTSGSRSTGTKSNYSNGGGLLKSGTSRGSSGFSSGGSRRR